MENKLVGVLGGLGPKATAYFIDLVVENTSINCDQDNVDMLVYVASSIPDRTQYINNRNMENPLEKMIEVAQKLEQNNCDFIVMPCNAAHYFYKDIVKKIKIPFYNIIEETLKEVNKRKIKKIGLMATEGTVNSGIYSEYLSAEVQLFTPCWDIQKKITNFIYLGVKKNQIVNRDDFMEVIAYFKQRDCEAIILGCTEISVLVKDLKLNDDYLIDSLTILARKVIRESGKKIK